MRVAVCVGRGVAVAVGLANTTLVGASVGLGVDEQAAKSKLINPTNHKVFISKFPFAPLAVFALRVRFAIRVQPFTALMLAWRSGQEWVLGLECPPCRGRIGK